MASLPGPESRDVQEMIRRLKWSHAEKQFARKAFELALDREFQNVIHRAKDMAGKIEQPADLWELEHYLTQSRKKIDRTFEYRYSVLTEVFGRLIRERLLSEKELQGLGQEKLESIRSYAKFLAEFNDVA
jgi:hypothetical protein